MKNERVIKFRAWTDQPGMIENFCWLQGDENHFRAEDLTNGPYSHCNILHVMQFTGLLDKNGKEIYEGDIVKTSTDKALVIGWSPRFASFVIMSAAWMFTHWFGEAMDALDCEVIGNIYENQNLLK